MLLWVGGYVAYLTSIHSMQPDNLTEKTDAIVVLTGDDFRTETGLDLWAQKLAPELFISGVYTHVKPQEIIESWKGKTPLPYCCLTLGYEATSTIENATETKAWIAEKKIKSIRLVTSHYHMPRARLEFTILSPDIKIIQHPVIKSNLNPEEERFWKLSFIEYHKLLWRLAQKNFR